MAKKVLLKDENSVEILPITRGELILDSSGKQALHSDEFLATTSQPGLMSKEDKSKIDNISISTLEITDLLPNGKKIATISVGTTPYTIFAPESYDWSKIDNKPETIYNYGMVETLSDLNNAKYWKFFQSTFQAENIAGRDLYNNWLSGITLGNDYITPYRVQFGLGYDGTAYSRYEKDHVWSSWKRLAFSNDKLSQFTDDVVAGKYLPLSGGTLSGQLGFSGTKYPHIYGNGTYLGLGYNQNTSQVVVDSTSLRRGSSTTGMTLGTTSYRWSKGYITSMYGTNLNVTNIYGNIPTDGTYNAWRILPYNGTLLIQAASGDGTTKNGKISVSGHEGENLEALSFLTERTYFRGNIGVGVTSPSEKFEVSGNAVFSGFIKSSASTADFSTLVATSSSDNSWNVDTHSNLSLVSLNNKMCLGVSGVANSRVGWIQVGHTSKDYSSYLGKLLLNPFGGNVGIGTSSPSEKLEVSGNVKATIFIGNIDGTYVNKLTGYTKATTNAAIVATDSLNTALGKLELKADTAYELVKGAYDGDGTIENLAEILKVLEGIKDTDTIQEIVGKYLPLTGGTLTNSLTVQNAITVDMSAFGNAQVIFKTLNGTGFLLYVKEDDWRFANEDFSVHRKILHSGNFSNYALPKDGTAADSSKFGGMLPRYYLSAPSGDFTDFNGAHWNTIYEYRKGDGVSYDNDPLGIGWGAFISLRSNKGTDGLQFLAQEFAGTNKLLFRCKPRRSDVGQSNEWSEVASLDSNVASATKLATPRTIWGQSFDGTENISGVISRATAIWGNKPEGGEYHNYRIIPYVNRLLFQIASYDGTSKNGVLELSGWESANLEKFAIFSSETTHNGTFTVGSLLTAKGISTGAAITLTGTDSSTSTIAFSRTTYNYITSPAGGDIGLQPGGLTKNSATGYKFTVSEFRPGANNVYNLGLLEYRWKNVYATNFVGNTASLTSTITSSGFIKTESSNDYVLLGGGSHKAISDFVVKGDELTSNLTTITKTLTVSRDWVDTDIIIDSATFPDGDGSYAVQISRSSYYVFTGVITLLPSQAGRVSVEDSDEIILHGGGFDATFQYYLRTKHDTTNKVVKLQMARNNMDDRSLTFTFKFKKLI